MNNHEGFSENDWDERGDLIWNEFDWERYLREQDKTLKSYLGHYEGLKGQTERIDQVAHLMGWDQTWTSDDMAEGEEEPDDKESADEVADFDLDPYTLHKNPIFISTKALCLSLKVSWERLTSANPDIGSSLALPYYGSLSRGEENALEAVHAIDMGDYSLGVCLLKRALVDLNASLALLDRLVTTGRHRRYSVYRDEAQARLFDLREIWLRVMAECREELERRIDDEG